MHSLEKFFEPDSIAVVGASRDKTKLGRMVYDNIISGGYRGKVYPVNPKAGDIDGMQVYASVEVIPYDVDLAILIIPAEFVLPTIKQCANKGIKGVVIITAGFGETGEEGKLLEEQIAEIGRATGMRILGPNCLGFINPKINLNASFSRNVPKEGNIGFVSQSGAFGTAMLDWAEEAKLGFDLFVSIGNKADISENDVMEYWLETKVPGIVVSYLEDIRDGIRFGELNQKLTRLAPHLILKPGRTEAAIQAIQSHTGSLAGSDEVISTAFKQYGILRAEGMHDLFDQVRAFAQLPMPAGDRVAIVTNAGGPAVMTTDYIETHGLHIARFDTRTKEILAEKLPRAASIHDPVDVLGDSLADRYANAIDAVLGDPNVDAVIILLTPQVMTQITETAIHISRLAKVHNKTVIASFIGGKYVEEGRKQLEELGVPVYHYPDRAVLALKAMNDYRKYLARMSARETLGAGSLATSVDVTLRLQVEDIIQETRSKGQYTLEPGDSLRIAQNYGLRVPESRVVVSEETAVEAAQKFGYPVVMKVASDKLLHKTEVGGVELNVRSDKDVIKVFNKMQNILTESLGVSAEQLTDGVEIQKQIVGGEEIMIGVKKNPSFGHLLLVGKGGIYTEIYKDFSTRIAPIDLEEAREMLRETKVIEILNGFRNLPKRDVGCIAEYLVKISQLVHDFPMITELDINPLLVMPQGNGCYAVDVKIQIASGD